MSGLVDALQLAIKPIYDVAARLPRHDRDVVENALDQVVAIGLDEEQMADVSADLLNDAINEAEDK